MKMAVIKMQVPLAAASVNSMNPSRTKGGRFEKRVNSFSWVVKPLKESSLDTG